MIKNIIFLILPYLTIFIGINIIKNAWASILLYHLGILSCIFINKKKLPEIKLKINNKTIFYIGIILTALPGLFIYSFWNSVKLPAVNVNQLFSRYGLSGYSFIIFIFYFTFINPVLEELFWRISLTKKKDNIKNYLYDIIFSGYHIIIIIHFTKVYIAFFCFIILFLAGLTWRFIYNKYSDLLTIFITHMIADLSIILSTYLLYLEK